MAPIAVEGLLGIAVEVLSVNCVEVVYDVVELLYVYTFSSLIATIYLPVALIATNFQACSSPLPPEPSEPPVFTGDWEWAGIVAPKSVEMYNLSSCVPTIEYCPVVQQLV